MSLDSFDENFPEIKPTTRSWDAGQFPIKSFNAQNGAEIRILYGNMVATKRLQLTYENLTDSESELFFDHYLAMKGTFRQFTLTESARSGWEGKRETLGLGGDYFGLKWRYEEPPQINSVFKGRSSVTVNLIAVPV